jgi:ferric-dicitrate binding protein FerR (iron transport regulator)
MTEQNQLWLLLARKLSGEITETDNQLLNDLLQKHPDKQYIAEILHSYFGSALNSEDNDEQELHAKFKRIIQHKEIDPASNNQPIRRIGGVRRYAAIITVVVATGGLIYYFTQRNDSQKILAHAVSKNHVNEITSNAGAKTKMRLPDGSLVWLNSSSKLTYQGDFNKSQREVTLEGEGFFDVAKNPGKPFIVHTHGIDIKVLGTAFNVKCYAADETIETTLLRGSVEVIRKNDPAAPAITLKPNEKLVYNKNTPKHTPLTQTTSSTNTELITENMDIVRIPVNIPDSNKTETSWVYNKLIFEGDNFTELAKKMERWFNVSIVFKDEKIKNYRFKGSFANESINEALVALQISKHFSYEINGTTVEVSSKK